MPVRTARVYDPPTTEDGLRVLTMRYWPRGVRRERADAWERGLAPTRELLADYRQGRIDWPAYAARYLTEMDERTDAREALARVRGQAAGGTVTLLCGCVDEQRCHRTLLAGLITGS
ncbi:MAG: DUF488 family protein [Chloroflexota bacterium]